jgi:nucleotidyltransferase/DNA polymerase involved in DNA repair
MPFSGQATAKGAGPPSVVTIAPPGEEAALLAPLPYIELWDDGPKTASRLVELGTQTIGELAA